MPKVKICPFFYQSYIENIEEVNRIESVNITICKGSDCQAGHEETGAQFGYCELIKR